MNLTFYFFSKSLTFHVELVHCVGLRHELLAQQTLDLVEDGLHAGSTASSTAAGSSSSSSSGTSGLDPLLAGLVGVEVVEEEVGHEGLRSGDRGVLVEVSAALLLRPGISFDQWL